MLYIYYMRLLLKYFQNALIAKGCFATSTRFVEYPEFLDLHYVWLLCFTCILNCRSALLYAGWTSLILSKKRTGPARLRRPNFSELSFWPVLEDLDTLYLPTVDDHIAIADITGKAIEAAPFEPGVFGNDHFQLIVANSLQVTNNDPLRAIQDDLLANDRMRPFRVESLRD